MLFALQLGILRAAFWSLDLHRLKTVLSQIVRAGPHIDFASRSSQVECIGNNLRGAKRRYFVGESIEIHVHVQAPRLIVLDGRDPAQFPPVSRRGSWSKKTVGIEMRTMQRLRLH